jgi:hypothetical protein
MGRAAACGAVTWFAVLRNFELTRNGPSVGKNRWGRFLLLTVSDVWRGLPAAGGSSCDESGVFRIALDRAAKGFEHRSVGSWIRQPELARSFEIARTPAGAI